MGPMHTAYMPDRAETAKGHPLLVGSRGRARIVNAWEHRRDAEGKIPPPPITFIQ